MSINGIYNKYDSYRFGFGFIDTIQKLRSVTSAQNKVVKSSNRDHSTNSMQHAMRMRKALEAIKAEMVEPEKIRVVSPASATSISSLNLDTTGTATTMQSTEEVNATPTSFSPFGPEWNGGSSAQVTISGEYDGSNDTGTITFTVHKQGAHGEDNLQIRVYDSNNQEIDKIDISKGESINQQYTLTNGLVLTLDEGNLLKNDTFTVDVFDTVGSAVDPEKSFNGIRNYNPNLEYGLSITSGSFQINGVTIDVSDDDTINSVLDMINQSDAGVTATFDADLEKVLLTQNTPGPNQDIVLENDTSGFLEAVKLDEATAIPGEKPETEKSLAEVDRFSSMQSGHITVNGESINIDINTDSLTDVLDRISESNADVIAIFDISSQRVSLNSNNPDNQLNIESGITNFFPALGISDGTYNSLNDLIHAEGIDVVNAPDLTIELAKKFSTDNSDLEAETKSVTAPDGKMLGTLVKVIASSMNALFDDSSLASSSTPKKEEIRNGIRDAITSSFDSEGPQYDTDFGIHFDFQRTAEEVFNFSETDQRQFETALTSLDDEAKVRNALFGKESSGLFSQLHGALTSAIPDSDSNNGVTGLFLDIVI